MTSSTIVCEKINEVGAFLFLAGLCRPGSIFVGLGCSRVYMG